MLCRWFVGLWSPFKLCMSYRNLQSLLSAAPPDHYLCFIHLTTRRVADMKEEQQHSAWCLVKWSCFSFKSANSMSKAKVTAKDQKCNFPDENENVPFVAIGILRPRGCCLLSVWGKFLGPGPRGRRAWATGWYPCSISGSSALFRASNLTCLWAAVDNWMKIHHRGLHTHREWQSQ